jgi:hypothetical protein
MKLQYRAPGLVVILLLFGISGSARAQSPSFLFGSAERIPTRLFGSSDDFGYCHTCTKTTTFGSGSGCGCEQKSRAKPAISLASFLRRSSDCDSKSASDADRGCKSSVDCAADKGCGNQCGCSCRRSFRIAGLSKAFEKLDGAVKRLFHCDRSVCCDPCYRPVRYCNVCPPKGYDVGCGCEPAWTPLSPPQHDIEPPSLEGDPFEDDPVQPLPPPIPSEAQRQSESHSPIRAVNYTQPARRPNETSAPPRLHSDNATSMTKRERLTQSMLDCLD